MRISKPSPSRQGKKQVIAFLPPAQIRAAYAKAAAEEKTNQEVIAEALNAVFEEHGLPALIPVEHRRIVRRSRGKARVRDEETGPACRAGKQSYGGWFDESVVLRLNQIASELSFSIQGIIERGIFLVTGAEPLADLDSDGAQRKPRRRRRTAEAEATQEAEVQLAAA